MSDYWSGFLTGAVASVIVLVLVSSLLSILNGYIRKIQAANKPQTVTQETKKTPNQVVNEAKRAQRMLWIWLGILYLGFIALLEYFRPGTLNDVMTLFGF